jgi:voltage-gated potassium channel
MLQLQFRNAAKRQANRLKRFSRKGVKRRLLETSGLVGLALTAHTGAMMLFEGLPLKDAIWLTATTITTVGYGDMSAASDLGRLSTGFLMYVAGISLFAQAASYYFEYRQAKKDMILNGKWRWKMKDHIVFMNAPERRAEKYFSQLMKAFRSSSLPGSDKAAVIVSDNLTSLSDTLREQSVTFVNDEEITSRTAFTNASIDKASTIVILAKDESDPAADSVTFDLVSRTREENPNAQIIAEAVNDSNEQRLKAIGADHVIRPIRVYPEMVVRTMLAPGSEEVIKDVFDSEGEEVTRYDADISGTWGEVQTKLIMADVGTPLAFINKDGQIIANASPQEPIENGSGVFAIVREGNHKTPQEILQILQQGTFVPVTPTQPQQAATTGTPKL